MFKFFKDNYSKFKEDAQKELFEEQQKLAEAIKEHEAAKERLFNIDKEIEDDLRKAGLKR